MVVPLTHKDLSRIELIFETLALIHLAASQVHRFSSLLQFVVKILEAKNLMTSDMDSSSDPFCVIEVLGTHKKTRIIHDSISPIWDEVFVYDLLDLYQRYFSIEEAQRQDKKGIKKTKSKLGKAKDRLLSYFFEAKQEKLSKEYVYDKLRKDRVKNVNVKLSVYDKDNFDNDDFLGSCMVNIDWYGSRNGDYSRPRDLGRIVKSLYVLSHSTTNCCGSFIDGAEKRVYKTLWEPLENVPDGTVSQLHFTIESRYRSFDNQSRKEVLEEAAHRLKAKLENNDFTPQHVSKDQLDQLWEEMAVMRMQVDTLERQLRLRT